MEYQILPQPRGGFGAAGYLDLQKPLVWFLGRHGSRGSFEYVVGLGHCSLVFFSGENTDQCVAESMQDAYTKGWDCLMLSDGCGTTSPEFATQCIKYNCKNGWNFVLTCQQFADGVNNIQNALDAEK
jgi:hypothetical protein